MYGEFSKTQDAKAVMNEGHKHPKLHHINIEPTDNGFMVESHHESGKKTKDGEPIPYDHEVTKKHFGSHEEAASHVSDVMGHHAQNHMTAGDHMRRNSVVEREEDAINK
jgi:hypothetical protein